MVSVSAQGAAAYTAHWNKVLGVGMEVDRARFAAVIASSPIGSQYPLTERLLLDFIRLAIAPSNTSPPPAKPLQKPGGASSRIMGVKTSSSTPKTLLSRARRRSSPSPTREGRSSPPPKSGQRLYGASHFAVACEELPGYADALFASTIIVGNGRSVLGQRAGPAVDQFARVIRFNDFQISGFEADVGRKVDLWCVSDWTALKLFNKYPDRKLPTLIAIPYKFMGKP